MKLYFILWRYNDDCWLPCTDDGVVVISPEGDFYNSALEEIGFFDTPAPVIKWLDKHESYFQLGEIDV